MPTSAQQAYDQSVSVISPVIEGEELPADRTEEYIEEARDRLRADMRFSRTSAAITPQIFTDVLRDREEAEYRRYSTVRVEETGPELPASRLRIRSLQPILQLAPLQDRTRWPARDREMRSDSDLIFPSGLFCASLAKEQGADPAGP